MAGRLARRPAGRTADRIALSLAQIESPRPANRVSVLSVVVAAPEHDIRFSTLHPLSPHRSLGAVLDRRTVLRLSAAGQLEQEIEDRGRDAEQAAQSLEDGGESRIIVGDLNLPPDSAIYRKFWAGYHNAFSEAGLGFGYTEWPRLRRMEFGIRIDHVLSGPNWRPRRCWVGTGHRLRPSSARRRSCLGRFRRRALAAVTA